MILKIHIYLKKCFKAYNKLLKINKKIKAYWIFVYVIGWLKIKFNLIMSLIDGQIVLNKYLKKKNRFINQLD
jgi:hypothetical protein